MKFRSWGQTIIVLFMVLTYIPKARSDRALVIGVEKYLIPENNLVGIDLDVQLMVQTLQKMGLQRSDIKVLQNEEANADNTIKVMKEWLLSEPQDRVFIYYSGHGTQVIDANGDEVEDQLDEALVLYDCRVVDNKLAGVLSDDLFHQVLTNIPAKETFVFIDACHSGTISKSGLDDSEMKKFLDFSNQIPEIGKRKAIGKVETSDFAFGIDSIEKNKGKKYSVLSACQDNESALTTKNGSYFTLGVIEALNKGLQSGQQYISMKEIHQNCTAFIQQKVSVPAKKYSPNLTGDAELSDRGIRLKPDPVGSETSNTASNTPEPPEIVSSLWGEVEHVVSDAAVTLDVKPNKTRFRLGEHLVISVESSATGYMYVMNISEGDDAITILFPNKYSSDNKVQTGTTISIPSDKNEFRLPASPPTGKTMVAAIVSTNPIEELNEEKIQKGALFTVLSPDGFNKNFVPQEGQKSSYSAGKVILEIVE